MDQNAWRGARRREAGGALLAAVLLLVLMGVIGLASMDTATRDRQVAGYQKRAQTALYAAEAGVSHGVGLIRSDAQALAQGGIGALAAYDPSGETPPRFPTQATATDLNSDFPAPGSPTYFMDPDASDPNDATAPPQAIRYIGRGEPCPGWVMSASQGNVQWSQALWDIRVRGRSPGGTEVSLQATGANCHPYN